MLFKQKFTNSNVTFYLCFVKIITKQATLMIYKIISVKEIEFLKNACYIRYTITNEDTKYKVLLLPLEVMDDEQKSCKRLMVQHQKSTWQIFLDLPFLEL